MLLLRNLSESESKEATDFSSAAVFEPRMILSTFYFGGAQLLARLSGQGRAVIRLGEVEAMEKRGHGEGDFLLLADDFLESQATLLTHLHGYSGSSASLTSKTLPLMYRSQVSHLMPNWEW